MEYDERFLAPSFKGERTSVMFWGAVAHGFHSPLVAIRQQDAKERTHEKDKLGINSSQYCKEVLGEFLLPILKEGSEVIEDGAPIYTSKETCSYRLQYGIHRIEWSANSPDPNLIENAWGLLKNKLRKQWRTVHIPEMSLLLVHRLRGMSCPGTGSISGLKECQVVFLLLYVEGVALAGGKCRLDSLDPIKLVFTRARACCVALTAL